MPAERAAATQAADRSGQTGFATLTCATQPVPKNDFSRAKVRSTNWSTMTKSPGVISSLKLPQALMLTRCVTPSRFIASIFAR